MQQKRGKYTDPVKRKRRIRGLLKGVPKHRPTLQRRREDSTRGQKVDPV